MEKEVVVGAGGKPVRICAGGRVECGASLLAWQYTGGALGGGICASFFSRSFVKAASSFAQIFIHRDPVDMRRGINGLSELVQTSGMGDLRGKNLFVFSGRRKDSIKVLYFDRSGFCLWQKRLEQEKFPWPKKLAEGVVSLTPQQFTWLLEGFDV